MATLAFASTVDVPSYVSEIPTVFVTDCSSRFLPLEICQIKTCTDFERFIFGLVHRHSNPQLKNAK